MDTKKDIFDIYNTCHQSYMGYVLFRITKNKHIIQPLCDLINQTAEEIPTDVLFSTQEREIFFRQNPQPLTEMPATAREDVLKGSQPINIDCLPQNKLTEKATVLRNRLRLSSVSKYLDDWNSDLQLYLYSEMGINGFPNYPEDKNFPIQNHINIGLTTGCFDKGVFVAAITAGHEFAHNILNKDVAALVDLSLAQQEACRCYYQEMTTLNSHLSTKKVLPQNHVEKILNPVVSMARREEAFCHCVGLILAHEMGYDISRAYDMPLSYCKQKNVSQISILHPSPRQWCGLIHTILKMRPQLQRKGRLSECQADKTS